LDQFAAPRLFAQVIEKGTISAAGRALGTLSTSQARLLPGGRNAGRPMRDRGARDT
jgi:hypothetical protein